MSITPRRLSLKKLQDLIAAAGRTGVTKITIDPDGKITLELPPPTDPSEQAERNEWDIHLDQLEKRNRS